jgi:hypothetical protein
VDIAPDALYEEIEAQDRTAAEGPLGLPWTRLQVTIGRNAR